MDFKVPAEYEVISEKVIEELNADARLLCHKKSGARLFLLSCDDENKVFIAGFRTPAAEDTGVPHIMEHSVLCGSEKYKAKDPFVELVKGSLNTFLNAMTYPDKTVYPVASCNDKDLANLMSVYLDALFAPAIYDNENIFLQEGWHYELTDPEGPLTINGVVYNEMKGVYSSADSILDRYLKLALFPDTVYGYESGGDPDHIPELTREHFLDFHRTYYHPSNCQIFLYGNMDMEERLEYLDREYLGRFNACEVDSGISMQQPAGPAEYEYSYPIGEDEDPASNTYISLGIVTGDSLDPTLNIAFQVLEYALLSSPGAPLRQAILDAGIGTDVEGGYEGGILQPVFSVTAKNAEPEDKDRFLEVVNGTLEDLCENGLDRKTLASALNILEFRYREADFGSYPRGLMYGLQCFESWLYDKDDPYAHLEYGHIFEELKSGLDGGYFEDLIKTYLIDNTHRAVVVLKPEPGLDLKKEAALAERLAAKLDAMSMEERVSLIERTEALKKYQDEPSTPEELATIPMLGRSDIDRAVKPLNYTVKDINGIPAVHTEMFTGGISYVTILFDAGSVAEADWECMGMLKILLGLLSTEDHSYAELTNEINSETGGIGSGIGIYPADGGIKLAFEFSGKAFEDKTEKIFEFTQEMIGRTLFDDEKRIKELISRTRSQLRDDLASSGHRTAAVRAGSYGFAASALSDAIYGIRFYEYVDTLEKEFDTRKDELVRRLRALMEQIFRKENLMISVTAQEAGYERVREALPAFADALSGSGATAGFALVSEEDVNKVQRNEAFKIPSMVQYVARSGSFADAGLKYTGALRVLQVILGYDYLWIQVRVKGGAYGVMNSYSRSGESYFVSYRDPKLSETNDVFEGIPAYIEAFDADDDEMTKYIIGTVSNLDMPQNPNARGSRNLGAYISGISEERLQRERLEVICAQAEDIRALAGHARAVLETGSICVLGSDAAIEADKGLFKEIKRLS